MKSMIDLLPPGIARQVHPDQRKNEAGYWAVRDQLLDRYRDQWIGFADGRVIASGTSAVEVLHAADATGLHPFLICVGREEEPTRIRRATFSYDANYPIEALPVMSVEFRRAGGIPGTVLDRVIPDTGADASILPWVDCQSLQLTASSGRIGLMQSPGGTGAGTLTFHILARLDGQDYPCRLQADFVGGERILGRDVYAAVEAA
jgi:hypothetical protein